MDVDVPQYCEMSPLPLHIVLTTAMAQHVKDELQEALRQMEFCNLVYHLHDYKGEEVQQGITELLSFLI